MFQMQYMLSSTGWESADYLYIHIDLSSCAASGTVLSLIDTRGSDIDDLMIEGSWHPLTQSLAAYTGCTAQLIVEHSSNSSSEELGLDDIRFSEGMILPVRFVRFDATPNRKTIDLHWSTSSEINNSGFEIQRSYDARQFEPIAFVPGAGNSTQLQRYHYRDHPDEAVDQVFYRLQQIDYDGASEFSAIISVQRPMTGISVGAFYPNPASTNERYIDIHAPADSKLHARIYDTAERLVHTTDRPIAKGANHLVFPFDLEAPGVYVARFNVGSIVFQRCFVQLGG